MDKRHIVLVFSILVILAGSGVTQTLAQTEGDAAWLPIKSWKWDKQVYETSMVGAATPFTALITFENKKGQTATITALKMATSWNPQPTWTGEITIAPGAEGTIELEGNIAAGQTGDQLISLEGTVSFDGTAYKLTWFNVTTISTKAQAVPGFPVESIALGLIAAVIVLFIRRGKSLPKTRFQ